MGTTSVIPSLGRWRQDQLPSANSKFKVSQFHEILSQIKLQMGKEKEGE